MGGWAGSRWTRSRTSRRKLRTMPSTSAVLKRGELCEDDDIIDNSVKRDFDKKSVEESWEWNGRTKILTSCQKSLPAYHPIFWNAVAYICAIISHPQNVMTKTPLLGKWYQARNARVCFYLWEQKISPLTSTATSHNWTQGSPSCKRQDDLQSWKSKWCRRLEEEDAEVASLSVSDLTQLTTTPPPDTDCPEWWSLCGNEPRG